MTIKRYFTENKKILEVILIGFVVTLFISLIYLTLTPKGPAIVAKSDLTNYLTGARIIRDGLGEKLYDIEVQSDIQSEISAPYKTVFLPFRNPPIVGIPFIPLTHLSIAESYKALVIMNIFLLIGFLVLSANYFRNLRNLKFWYILPLFFIANLHVILQGQISFILAIIFLFLYTLIRSKKSFGAGILCALLFIRPQFLLIFPFVLLLAENKREFIKGFALTIFILIVGSVLITGPDFLFSYPAFVLSTERLAFGSNIEGMATFTSSLYSTPLASFVEYRNLILLSSLFYLGALVIFIKNQRNINLSRSYIVAMLFTLVFSVHALGHDLGILLVPMVILIDLAAKGGARKGLYLFFAFVLFLVPLAIMNLSPLVATISLLAVALALVFPKFLDRLSIGESGRKDKSTNATIQKKYLFAIVIITFVFLLFWTKATISLDPDFGYRLSTGAFIVESGFPVNDLYSYTMPSFAYVEHAWGVAVLWAILFPIVGKTGLAFLGAVLALGALVISSSRAKTKSLFEKPFGKNLWHFGKFPFLLAIAVVLPFTGVRAQVFTWVMMASLLWLLFNDKIWKKGRYILPIFFVFWANLHGGFAAGLAVLISVVVIRAIRFKKLDLIDLSLVVISILITFANPYGPGIWHEVLSSVTDSQLRWQIVEWMPAIFMVDISFMAFLPLSFLLIFKYRKRFSYEELFLYLIFLAQAFLSRRHIPLWVIVTLPMLIQSLSYFYEEIYRKKFAIERFKKAYLFAWGGSLLILLIQAVFVFRSATALQESNFYPQEAVVYLKNNLPQGEIFSLYGWGGYLTWKMPEKKVFVDGRMPSWRRSDAPPTESDNAFDDYIKVLNGESDYKTTFSKYGVEVVLWPVPTEPRPIDLLEKRLESLITGKEDNTFNLSEKLLEDGWDIAFQDSVSIVFKNLKVSFN